MSTGNNSAASSKTAPVVAAEINLSFINDEQQHHSKVEEQKELELASKTTRPVVAPTSSATIVKRAFCSTRRIRYFLYATIVLLLLVAFITVLVLYVKRIQENDKQETSEPCLEEICISSASEILKYMNSSVDPCEDFFTFACGGWQAKTLMNPSETAKHMFTVVTNANNNLLRNLIANSAIREKYKKNRAVMKSFKLYQMCLSRMETKEKDVEHLKEVIEKLGGSNITTPNWNPDNFDVQNATVKAIRDYGVDAFFALDVYYDLKNATTRRLIIWNGGLNLQESFYLKQNSTDEYYTKTRKGYKEFMVDVMKLFGVDPQQAERQMEQVFLFEQKMAEATRHKGGPSSTTIKELPNLNQYDWLTFFLGLTENQSYQLNENETILLGTTATAMQELMSLINNTDKAVLSNYIAWSVIEEAVEHLPDEYRQARLAFDKKVYGETYEETEEWLNCLKFTKNSFPQPIGLVYVDRSLTPEARARANEIFEEIRREFLRELDSQTWMDDTTRAQAKAKAEATVVVTGYPDFIKDEEKLNAKYANAIVTKGNYLKTAFGLKSFTFMDKVADLRLPSDRKSFEFSPAVVNAYYTHQQNKISFLAGILRPPFFNIENIRASNYGGIGMIAGHELTHGFDTFGSMFDKYGNLKNWWSKLSLERFQNKSKCLMDQYSQYTYYGKNVSGTNTVTENIADNGGIKFAYKAYRRWVDENGEEDKLPGLDFTPNQLFFITYAQGWCSKYTREAAFNQLDNMPWPTNNVRVKGVIRNMEPFAQAFNCKPGSPMSPEKRCEVW